jgi:hypothetical protein
VANAVKACWQDMNKEAADELVGREPHDLLPRVAAIESCRTAALGGHVARCEDCAHEVIAYTSSSVMSWMA